MKNKKTRFFKKHEIRDDAKSNIEQTSIKVMLDKIDEQTLSVKVILDEQQKMKQDKVKTFLKRMRYKELLFALGCWGCMFMPSIVGGAWAMIYKNKEEKKEKKIEEQVRKYEQSLPEYPQYSVTKEKINQCRDSLERASR